jgi:hypothetical protein
VHTKGAFFCIEYFRKTAGGFHHFEITKPRRK